MKARDVRINRLRGVVREYRTAQVAVNVLAAHLREDPSALDQQDLKPLDFRRFRANLEATYQVRHFAEFESALRNFWESIGRETQPRSADLIDAISSRRRLPTEIRQSVHEVRLHRNAMVHEESGAVGSVEMPEAVRRLERFLSRLPANW